MSTILPRISATTILAVRRNGQVALGGDGQVTVGDTIMKSNAQKVRALQNGKLLAGFAGAAADAFTLFEKFEEKLQRYPDNLPRAAVELAKEWRSDRMLRKLEALLVVASREHGFITLWDWRHHRARRWHPGDWIRGLLCARRCTGAGERDRSLATRHSTACAGDCW